GPDVLADRHRGCLMSAQANGAEGNESVEKLPLETNDRRYLASRWLRSFSAQRVSPLFPVPNGPDRPTVEVFAWRAAQPDRERWAARLSTPRESLMPRSV